MWDDERTDAGERARRGTAPQRPSPLAQSLQQYQFATLGTLVSGVAHELNNIAMVLDGVSAGVADRAAAGQPADHDDRVELDRACERLTQLGKQMRAQAKQEPDVFERVDLRLPAGDALAVLKGVGRLKYLELDARLGQVPVLVHIPKRRTTHLLINLLANLAEVLQSIEGGSHRLRVEVQRNARASSGVCLIEAGGAAFPPNTGPALFDPRAGTAGVGLQLLEDMLEPSGGHWAIERPDETTIRVRIELPEVRP